MLGRAGFWLWLGRVGFWVGFRAAEFQLWQARAGGGVLWEFLGGDVPLGPWNP